MCIVLWSAAAIFGGRNSTSDKHESESVCRIFAPLEADWRNLSSLKASWQQQLRHRTALVSKIAVYIATSEISLSSGKYPAWSSHDVTWKTSTHISRENPFSPWFLLLYCTWFSTCAWIEVFCYTPTDAHTCRCQSNILLITYLLHSNLPCNQIHLHLQGRI